MKSAGGRLYQRVAAILAAKIRSGEYAVGFRLPSERDLAQALDVSRPTIREAIIALEVDGLVEVRKGAGVYVVSATPAEGAARANATDYGPFELIEARRLIEADACALAAQRITDEQIYQLSELLDEINSGKTYEESEDADRRFHLLIAQAAENSVLLAIVEMLWDLRARSPHYILLAKKAHEAGIGPEGDEHAMILAALEKRDPAEASFAMRNHLQRVLDTILEATEVHEVEEARARVKLQRQRFVASKV
ncbi:FadR/GntR family transcriptional regulator [Hephaestia mangrovi]|uniref:FadR/GntR family transcriptional regulator n=1 Tax=Hephaestia mangrovi TaxID=2873268 RepID=UPI001CA619FD|nr:FadR/GntR family transcriptional regulator [Hephaestia mangrovi]MBY8829867.1 FadR family transcriptional regulator [Hephaestia mangrovi]